MRSSIAIARTIAALLLALAALALPRPARAATFLADGQVVVAQGQTIDDDVYAFSGTITIDGRITRSLVVAGGTVTVNGQVDGDVTVAGGTITLNGPVGGTVRVAGGTVTINGPVGWDVVAAGGDVTVGSGSRIANDLVLGAGTVTVAGRIDGDLRGSATQARLLGEVRGDVLLDIDNQLSLGPQAVIGGDLSYRAPQAANIDPGARIQGQTRFTPTGAATGSERSFTERALAWLGSLLLRLAWALVAGTLLVMLLPRRSATIADTLRQAPVASLLWGIALLIAVPILAIILLITVVGVPAGLLLLGFYLAALYLSQVLLGLSLVRGAVPLSWRTTRRLPLWLAMLIGTSLVVLIRLLPLPFGIATWWTAILSFLIAVLALGAIWTDLTGWGKPVPALAPAAAPPPLAEETEFRPVTGPLPGTPGLGPERSAQIREERPITEPAITSQRPAPERPATPSEAEPAAGPAMTEPAQTSAPTPERQQPASPEAPAGQPPEETRPIGEQPASPPAGRPEAEEDRKER